MSSDQSSPRYPTAIPAGAAVSVRGWLPSWPWIVGFFAMLRALASPLALLHDPDTYLHVAAGRWMLAHHALPTADPFSYTMAGAHWAPSEWLGELVLAAVYDVAGWGGAVVLTASCFGAAIGLLTWFLSRRMEPLPAVIGALAGAVLVLPHLLARTHVLALPLLVLWCGAILAARDEERGPPWIILPAMLLWANLHGSFLFGIALAAYLGGEAVLYPARDTSRFAEARRWAVFVVAAAAVADKSQQRHRVHSAVPADGDAGAQSGFSEWKPADFTQFPALEAWLLSLIALGFFTGVRPRWTRIVLLVGLVHMALAHVRHADLLGLVGPLTVAAAFGPAVAELMRPAAGSPLLRGAAALARPASLAARALTIMLAVLASLPVLLRPLDRSGDAVTPQSALAAAARLGLDGRVFNSENFGGYLIFRGTPTFIDGRIELYGNDFLADYLAAERGDGATLAVLVDRYHVTWALLQAGSPVVPALERLPGWRRVYADDQAIVDRLDH